MNPLSALLEAGLPEIDVGVMSHGFADHGRDYQFIIEDCIGTNPGTYRLTFTHVVAMEYLTALSASHWSEAWSDDFVDYDRWEAAGEPKGYVFGTNWSNAYPGFAAIAGHAGAAEWSLKLGHPMHAASLHTERFKMTVVFHDALLAKLSDDAPTIIKVTLPIA
jgi:hypothetical protein